MIKPSGKRPKRVHTPREERRVYRLFTEGRVTEPSYLSRLEKTLEATLSVAGLGVDPLSLVQAAKAEKRKQPRKNPAFDEFWCIFDMDDHATIDQAVQEARDANINIALSNPCFELWLLLHSQDQTAWVHRGTVQKLVEEHGLIDGKQIGDREWSLLNAGLADAIVRASSLQQRHLNNGSATTENPSSGMWELLATMTKGDLKL